MPKLFEGARKNWKFVFAFLVFSLLFWLAEFAYQFYFASPGKFELSIVRSLGFSAATFISASLLTSIVFKFRPALAKYWHVRRSLGVAGFAFIVVHISAATNLIYNFNLALMYSVLDPFQNPLVFSALAYPIFFLMALTSTDWAVQKLGFAKWKAIHRLVYFAFLFSVFHFILINPPTLMNLAGYLLLALTALVLAGELYWFIKISSKNRFSGKGTIVGVILIVLYILFAYIAFFS
ncbi:MAG: hypothetical protein QT03_C0001G0101 [archaeon GW2011_AR10]|uniref:Ferric oxidoreductase domain-containing protein n=2 Tax=Candidatus Iainarchaeum sp. TaxID=3101447 RepID=A0A7J4IZ38_9ARCH|nr:MAG: hypothetical protein QT03_C0001G0101 [archaeon GW2011_AR10]HIH08236.1 hypothetical protein [Candidatus Diapherotrites archaeon]